MNLYFDMEFTGLKKDTTIISLGIVDQNGRSIYLEYTDYNKSDVDDWIQENVIKNTIFLKDDIKEIEPHVTENGTDAVVIGNTEYNRQVLKYWLSLYDNEDIQFVSDVCHYDMVLLIDALYGHGLNIPSNVSIDCHNINQDIAAYKKISVKEAADVVRESLVAKEIEGMKVQKHNALFDALVIRLIYNKINKLV